MKPTARAASAAPQPDTSANSAGESSIAYAGWRVVFAASLGSMVSFGSLLVYTFSVFLKPLTQEFGWSREEVSRAFGFAALSIAAASPALGVALDRWGARRVVLPAIAIFGVAFGSLGLLTPNLWHLYAVFIVIGLVGNATTQMGYSGAVSSWFDRRRGLALAVVLAGIGFGAMTLPLAAQRLIDLVGWRNAYLTLGGLVLLLGITPTALFVRARRSESTTAAVDGFRFGEALRTRMFWILVAVLFLSSLAANGAITQLSALLTDRGISPAHAAAAASVLGAASLLGRLATGWLLDRFFGGRVAFVLLLLLSGGVYLLANAQSPAVAFAAAALIGFGLGGEADVTPYLLTRYYGLQSFSALYGLTWTFYAAAGAAGPVILGRAFDATRSYSATLELLVIPVLISAALLLALPRYRRP